MDDQVLHSSPLVSIAVATYNGERFLEEQLESLALQSYKNLEIIISDDGSTDKTLAILSTFTGAHPQVSVFHNSGEHGVIKNFENALRHCNGELIALCDQDDIWLPEKIERMVREIGQFSLVYHDSLLIDDSGTSLQQSVVSRSYTGDNPQVFLLKNIVSGHACLFRKSILTRALPFPGGMAHDWWLAAVAADEDGIKFLDEVLVHYRQHRNNTTDFLGTRLSENPRTALDIHREELQRFESFKKLRKHQAFFNKWYQLNKTKVSKWVCPQLFYLSLANSEPLFFLYAKKKGSVFLRCINYFWGLSLKRMIDKKYNYKEEDLTDKPTVGN